MASPQENIYAASAGLPEIVRQWMRQLADPDVVRIVTEVGGRRRIDLTLYSDRERVNKPPRVEIV